MSNFLQFAEERGLLLRNSPDIGRWVRTATVDHPNKKNGAYIFYGDFGVVQNWATMTEAETWFSDRAQNPFEKELMLSKLKNANLLHNEERTEKQKQAASKAKWILSQCELDTHAYLDSKGFKDSRCNIWRKEGQDPILAIPMFYHNEICGVQLVGINGDKKFLTGQRTNDSTHTFDAKGKTYLVEGYATGLSLKAVLTALKRPYTIHICFSAGNLLRVSKSHPSAFIVADNDESKTGEKVAIESGCKWWMPETVGYDFNDLHKEVGTFKASQILRKVL